jgi:hypothetical protein
MCFTSEAMASYVDLTLVSFYSGLIPTEIFIDRLRYLVDGEPEQLETGESRDFSGAGQEVSDEQDKQRDANSLGGTPSSTPLEFKLSSQSDLHDWVFTSGDPDPLPSVPHGHWQTQNSQRKVDAYRGHITQKGKSDGRLTRNEVAEFWNDDEFREYARLAIVHALADPGMHRAIQNRGVLNPLKLPRIR